MATDLHQLQRFLTDLELKFNFREEQNDIMVFFETENFININGEQFIIIVLECSHNGEILQIFSPQAYQVPNNANKKALFELLLLLMQDTYFVKFEYYEQREEIRICIDLPLEDQILTQAQLQLCVHNIVKIVEQYHEVITKTIETGVIQREDSQLMIAKGLFDRILEEYTEDILP
jgi:hypothetical protein